MSYVANSNNSAVSLQISSPVFEYAKYKGLLHLPAEARARFNVSIQNLTLLPTDPCFSDNLIQYLLSEWVGYEMVLVNNWRSRYGAGYVRSVSSGVLYNVGHGLSRSNDALGIARCLSSVSDIIRHPR